MNASPNTEFKRQCVFCGDKPRSKTNEDIIPRWCSKLSGKDKIPIVLAKLNGELIKLPFKRLVLPACETCDNSKSEFENRPKYAFEAHLDGEINEDQATVILDWMDKIRVGLWRYELGLNDDRHSIEPRFAINQRIGAHDRIAIVQRLRNKDVEGIALSGISRHSFLRLPSVFGTIVRDVAIISYSGAYCLYDYFGMSFLKSVDELDGKADTSRVFKGFTSLDRSIRELSLVGGTQLFQFRDFFPGQHVGALNGKTFFNSGSGNQMFEEGQRVTIPRTSYGPESFGPLFELNVVELQIAARYVISTLPTGNRIKNNLLLKKELEHDASFWLDALNRNSVFYRRRHLISIPKSK